MTRLAVLERSHLLVAHEATHAAQATVEFAREIERIGYDRIWLAEHHSVPGIAGVSPTVLAMAVADATSRIRVGTGGVMLPNHQPLLVAEQLGVLTALHPQRIDLGVGRSLAFTPAIRAALATDRRSADGFREQLTELLGFLTGEPHDHPGVHAGPGSGPPPPVFLLTTGGGTDLAAELGLPLVITPVGDTKRMLDSIGNYRKHFHASRWAHRPHVIVSQAIAVGDASVDARRLLVPEAAARARATITGDFPALSDPDDITPDAMSTKERAEFERILNGQIYGTDDTVRQQLDELVTSTNPDEILITTTGFDQQQRLDSYRRLRELAHA